MCRHKCLEQKCEPANCKVLYLTGHYRPSKRLSWLRRGKRYLPPPSYRCRGPNFMARTGFEPGISDQAAIEVNIVIWAPFKSYICKENILFLAVCIVIETGYYFQLVLWKIENNWNVCHYHIYQRYNYASVIDWFGISSTDIGPKSFFHWNRWDTIISNRNLRKFYFFLSQTVKIFEYSILK